MVYIRSFMRVELLYMLHSESSTYRNLDLFVVNIINHQIYLFYQKKSDISKYLHNCSY